MLVYQRPAVTIEAIVDASGELIPYGSRYWGTDGDGIEVEPPAEAYSACAHPERFEPVAIVGRALVDYLVATYAVDRADSVKGGGEEIQLTPRYGGGTALTFTLGGGNLPGAVRVRAGWRFLGMWPDCGCDACDDDVEYLVDELEAVVLTIVEGGMTEWRTGPDPTHKLNFDDAGNAIGDDHIPWQAHVAFDGRVDHVSGDVSGSWSAGEPEPVEIPLEPHRWPAWPQVGDRV